MAIIAKNDGKEFVKIPPGMYQSVCAFVVDIGTQQSIYMNRTITSHQVVICWELDLKMTEGENAGKPFMISKFYTLSLFAKANLRKDLVSWRGKEFTEDELKGFDLEKLIGANCYLNIIDVEKMDGTTRSQIASINPVPAGTKKLLIINKSHPEWITKKRLHSIESMEGTSTENESDELPF